MIVSDYDEFVGKSDWTAQEDLAQRFKIAEYGISAEIGSLVSAVKKKMLGAPNVDLGEISDEIAEELGDIIWYTAMLASVSDLGSLNEVLLQDLTALQIEIEKNVPFKESLPEENLEKFFPQAERYVSHSKNQTFDDYQNIAILTSRTERQELVHVCLTRLTFYATVIMSKGFPQVEKLLQKDINDLPLQRALGMIMWHLAALASVYGTSLCKIVEQNKSKLSELSNIEKEAPTPLHDDNDSVPLSQRFPRHFEISFVSVGQGKLQMFMDGIAFGDTLTDNSTSEDGYRFHDIMHLANIAKLGWSPVLRSLMKRKRKYDPKIDEIQDGARAQIVEEAIVKAIHSEGVRVGTEANQNGHQISPLFTNNQQIPFWFQKLIKRLVSGLEVEKNRYWEWQEAILSGHEIYHKLRKEGQGTVTLDLNHRSISFDPKVSVPLSGLVVGIGTAKSVKGLTDISKLTDTEIEGLGDDQTSIGKITALKEAILDALGLETDENEVFRSFSVTQLQKGHISIKASGAVQNVIWRKHAITFQATEMTLEKASFFQVIALGSIN